MNFQQLSVLLIFFTLGTTSVFAKGGNKKTRDKEPAKKLLKQTLCDKTVTMNTHLDECELILRNQNSTGVGNKILRATLCGVNSPVIHEVRYYHDNKCYAVTLSRNENEQLEIKTLVQERGQSVYQSGTSKDKTLITEFDNFMRFSTVEDSGADPEVFGSLMQQLVPLSTSIDDTLSKPFVAGDPEFKEYIKFYELIKDKALGEDARPVVEIEEAEQTGEIK